MPPSRTGDTAVSGGGDVAIPPPLVDLAAALTGWLASGRSTLIGVGLWFTIIGGIWLIFH